MMKKSLLNRSVKAALLTLTLTSATHAFAESEPTVPEPVDPSLIEVPFGTADADKNGKLSLNEYLNIQAATDLMEYELTFAHMDADGDGKVHIDELQSFIQTLDDATTERYIVAAGEDATLNLEDFIKLRMSENADNSGYLWKFARLDNDRDQSLTAEEFFNPENYVFPPALTAYPGPSEPHQPHHPEPEVEIEPEPIELPEIEEHEVELPEIEEPEVEVEEPEAEIQPPYVEHPEEGEESDVSEADDDQKDIEEIKEKIAQLETTMERTAKAIERATEKLETATGKKVDRLERRRHRLSQKLAKLSERYAELMRELHN